MIIIIKLNVMETIKNNFTVKYGISKKGNKIIAIIQIPSEKNPISHEFNAFNCNTKFKEIIKIRTMADQSFYNIYLDKTVEEVFNIAVEKQDWKLTPFRPLVERILPPCFVTENFEKDDELVFEFFNKNPNGTLYVRQTSMGYTKNEWENKLKE
jgi:hypothetical protein